MKRPKKKHAPYSWPNCSQIKSNQEAYSFICGRFPAKNKKRPSVLPISSIILYFEVFPFPIEPDERCSAYYQTEHLPPISLYCRSTSSLTCISTFSTRCSISRDK